MKVLFLTPLLFLLSSPINAEVNHAKHEKCLQAADYEGCMDFQSGSIQSTVINSEKDCTIEVCYPDEVTQLTDNLGMKIIKGWKFKENPVERTSSYWDPRIYELNSGGETGRFFHQRKVRRYFLKGRSGTSGYFSSSGSGSINCNQSLYGNINCTSTSPSSTYIPGISGRPDRVEQVRQDVIYDCKDETAARLINKKIERFKGLDGKKKKWHRWDNLPNWWLFTTATNSGTREILKNTICTNTFKKGVIPASDLNDYFRDKGIKKRSSSNKKNVGNINCDSPVWKKSPRCN